MSTSTVDDCCETGGARNGAHYQRFKITVGRGSWGEFRSREGRGKKEELGVERTLNILG